MVRPVVRHAESAEEYCGSESKRRDVLHFYKICGGDMNKVVRCVPYGKEEDIERWTRDILDPAAVVGCNVPVREQCRTTRGREEKGRKGMAGAEGCPAPSATKRWRRTVLEDSSSSEEEGFGDGVSSSIMSKRNKMDYCAARRRKVMAEKVMGHHSWQQPSKKAGGISDELLSNLEEKYGQGNQGKKKKKKTMSRAR